MSAEVTDGAKPGSTPFCFFLPSVAALKWSRRALHIWTWNCSGFKHRLTPVCACWQSDREISECMSSRRRYKVQSTDRKCGRLTGRKALIFYCAGAKREFRNGESREDKTGERRRGEGRSRADRLRNEHWLSERVSVRKAQWLVGNL